MAIKTLHIAKNLFQAIARWEKQPVKIIAVAGKRKAGKSVFVGYVKKNYPQFRHLRIADAPVQIAKILGLSPERKILHALFGVNDLLRPIIGTSAYIRRVAMILDKERPNFVIVEALRTAEEYVEFVKKRGALLAGFDADVRIRHQRAVRQYDKADERTMALEEFIKKDHSPLEREVNGIIKKAHFVFENNHQTKQPFYGDIDMMMLRIGFTPLQNLKNSNSSNRKLSRKRNADGIARRVNFVTGFAKRITKK